MLGVLPGIIGSLQANEALKLALGIGDPLIGRLLLFDALAGDVRRGRARRDPDCPVCGEHPTITDYIDYVEFCAGSRGAAPDDRGPHPPDAARARPAARARSRPSGATVRELLDDLIARFPALGDQLSTDGDLAPFVNVYVDGEDVRTRERPRDRRCATARP